MHGTHSENENIKINKEKIKMDKKEIYERGKILKEREALTPLLLIFPRRL